MISDETFSIAEQFGVAAEQIERDHLISHLLAFLSNTFGDKIYFIGGTALARTHLSDGRLSEDIDLIAIGDRKSVAAELDAALPRSLARTHGRLILDPPLRSVPDTRSAIVRTSGGLTVRIQLLSSRDRIVWPTERRSLVQRYSDAPSAELLVPTLAAFAASKTATWVDRRAPRDLWDLWALTQLGAINDDAARLYRRYGPTNKPPAPSDFINPPTPADWHNQLAGQTRLTVSAQQALTVVHDAWARAVTAP